jgi:hypothetical protein
LSRKTLILSICYILIFFNQGCVVKKGIPVVRTAGEMSENEIVKLVVKNNLTSNSFYLKKAIVDYSDSLNSISFLLSVKYDGQGKYLFIARTLTGIELYRLFLDRDTFLLNDRLNKQIFQGDESYLRKKFGIGYGELNFMFGDFSDSGNLKSDGNPCIEGKKVFYTYNNNLVVKQEVNCYVGKLNKALITNGLQHVSLDIICSRFIKSNELNYPEDISVKKSDGELEIAVKIESIESPMVEKIEFIPGNNYEIIHMK